MPSKKVKFGKVPVVYPIPIILAGALVNGKPNFATLGLDPVSYALDNRYYRIGKRIGIGYQEGKKFRQQENVG